MGCSRSIVVITCLFCGIVPCIHVGNAFVKYRRVTLSTKRACSTDVQCHQSAEKWSYKIQYVEAGSTVRRETVGEKHYGYPPVLDTSIVCVLDIFTGHRAQHHQPLQSPCHPGTAADTTITPFSLVTPTMPMRQWTDAHRWCVMPCPRPSKSLQVR